MTQDEQEEKSLEAPPPRLSPHLRPPLEHGCDAWWRWSQHHKSPEVRLYARTALFHPNWSHGTAAVRGSHDIRGGVHYWEVQVSQRLFGTAIMFGVCTASARLHADTFVSLVGEDENGWGLSHKGLVWHAGVWRRYTEPFRENKATTIGVLYDGERGTLGFYKDERWLGVAFSGLGAVTESLYPVVSSTAAKTELTLGTTRRGWAGLQDRARHALLSALAHPHLLYTLPLPPALRTYLEDDLPPSSANAKDALIPTTTGLSRSS
ncbi:SPRY domain-containing SOCS box protein 3-like [Penaeus japonicus]|uniref:SPRY domain-containing SOCS box protein 3-like n=1 Tax=Penaeus japonicus TaxID=27405 RepID=UPI001C71783E|nr:SPRY domain-containing SOCS box protein 3-like [Penaeus japonicus]